MKKLIGIFMALCMLCTAVSATSVENASATPDAKEMSVSITYDALKGAQATMVAYKVVDGSTLENFPLFVNENTNPIVGLDQAVSNGVFKFKVAEDFEGTIAIIIGGDQVESPAKLIIKFSGIPNVITGEFDANNDVRVLVGGEVVEIEKNACLKNAVIDASNGGYVKNGSTILTGRMTFNYIGEVDADEGSTVKLYTEDYSYSANGKTYGNGDGTSVQGFIRKTKITSNMSEYVMVITAEGERDGSAYRGSKEIKYNLGANIYEGNACFKASVMGVPAGIVLTVK